MSEMQLIYKQIGIKIQVLRTALGWSQKELAEKVGLTRTSIVNIECGRQRMMLHDIENLAKIFNVTPKHFLKGVWW